MNEVLQLEVRLENGQFKVASSQVKGQVNDIGDATEKAGVRGRKGLSSIADGFSILQTAAKAFVALAVVQAIYTLGRAALKASSDMEKYTATFSTMMGSAEGAKMLMADIKQFAAETPFEIPGLVDSAQQLMAFGTSAGDMISTLEMLGNAAAGQSDKLARLTLAYGKLQAKGRASLEEINMFTEAGVPLLKALEKQLGVSTPVLFKMIETGKIGFKDVNKALQDLTTGSGKFAGLMELQSRSLGGMFSNLLDSLGQAVLAIGDKASPAFKLLIASFLNAMEAGGSFSMIISGLGWAFSKLGYTVATVVNTINLLSNTFMMGIHAARQFMTYLQLAQVEKALTSTNLKTKEGIKETQRLLTQRSELLKRTISIQKDMKSSEEQYGKTVEYTKESLRGLFGITKEQTEAEKKRAEEALKRQQELLAAQAAAEAAAKKKSEQSSTDTGSGQKKKSAADTMLEQWNARAEAIKQYYNLEISEAERAWLVQRGLEDQAADYYEEYLNKKFLLDSRYAKGLANVTATASTFMAEENVALFRFGQALAIAQVGMNTATGIMKTWAQWGWPIGAVGAAIIGAAGALEIKNIAKQKPPAPPPKKVMVEPKALATGGYVPGSPAGTHVIVGEQGRGEAVLPLDDPEAMNKLRGALGNNGDTFVFQGPVYGDEAFFDMVEKKRSQRARSMNTTSYPRENPYR